MPSIERFWTPTNRQDSRFGSRSDPKGEVQEAPSQRASSVAGRTPAIKSSDSQLRLACISYAAATSLSVGAEQDAQN